MNIGKIVELKIILFKEVAGFWSDARFGSIW
jgi:hypothetical protein